MFGGQQQQQQQQQQNVRSDSSWYQAQYEGGESSSSLRFCMHTNTPQPIAHSTSAPARCRASRSHTTVPARGKRLKIRLSLVRGLQFVAPRVGGTQESLPRRLSWQGRVCCSGVNMDNQER
jgi:hypothetical protein